MRRLVVAAVIVLAVVSLAGVALYPQQQAAARRLAIREARRDEDAIPAIYGQTFEWERADLTLDQFAELVTAKTGLAVEPDRKRLVHVPRGSFPLHTLLSMVLSPQGLVANVQGQKIEIT